MVEIEDNEGDDADQIKDSKVDSTAKVLLSRLITMNNIDFQIPKEQINEKRRILIVDDEAYNILAM